MTNRYDQLSDRALWYLQNFDEIDLADLCASQEASNEKRQEAIDRVRATCDRLHRASVLADGQPHTDRERGIIRAVERILAALDQTPPAHDDGPSVQEAAADDRRYWDVEKAGE